MQVRITDGFVDGFQVFNRGEEITVQDELGLEFIQRGVRTDEHGRQRLDLGFDSSNAQAIFKMTAA